jgi:protein-S-isoprenylcysteine O-methyltransferase Ste14
MRYGHDPGAGLLSAQLRNLSGIQKMAKDVNRTRMRDSRLLLLAALIVVLLSKPVLDPKSLTGEMLEVIGDVLLAICAIGRIYATMFIGGLKSDELITIGPYAMCRNPLYFYSLVGAAGVGVLSNELTIFVFLAGGFYLIYYGLIRREENFLAQKFGSSFTKFCKTTPRLLPDFRKFHAPARMEFQPRYVNKAVSDAMWWFAAMPIFEVINYLHDKGIVKPLFTLF